MQLMLDVKAAVRSKELNLSHTISCLIQDGYGSLIVEPCLLVPWSSGESGFNVGDWGVLRGGDLGGEAWETPPVNETEINDK